MHSEKQCFMLRDATRILILGDPQLQVQEGGVSDRRLGQHCKNLSLFLQIILVAVLVSTLFVKSRMSVTYMGGQAYLQLLFFTVYIM